ncbi:hypothetical protein STEG23_013670 [Scotinomys teguina]
MVKFKKQQTTNVSEVVEIEDSPFLLLVCLHVAVVTLEIIVEYPQAEVPPRPPRELRGLQDGSSGAQRGARGTDTDQTARKLELQDVSG